MRVPSVGVRRRIRVTPPPLPRPRLPRPSLADLGTLPRRLAQEPSSPLTVVRPQAAEAWRARMAVLLGAAIALSGFAPVVNLPSRLDVTTLPGFVALTPAAIIVYLAFWAARRSAVGSGTKIPIAVRVGLGLLVLGAALSLLQSARPAYSLTLALLGIFLPIALFLCLRRAVLPPNLLAGGFFAALGVLLLRADYAFLRIDGFPTSQTLFNAKFTNRAHDFHYYTLGNPNHTAAFLILPLAVAVSWAARESTARRTRIWLAVFAALVLATLVLAYERFPLLVAAVVVFLPLLRRGVPKQARLYLGFGLVVLLAVLIGTSRGQYFAHLFSLGDTPSAHTGAGATPSSAAFRVHSFSTSWHAFTRHPVTGVGLGMSSESSGSPAESAVIAAAAEMGLAGGLGFAVLVLAAVLGAARSVRSARPPTRSAAVYACGAYAVVITLSGGPPEGLFVGTVSVYALTVAMLGAIAMPAFEPQPLPVSSLGLSWHGTLRGLQAQLVAVLAAVAPSLRWLAYGALWVPVTLWRFRGVPSVNVMSSSREVAYNQLLAAHAHGFGPLVQALGGGSFTPAGISDDQGGYLFAPWLGSIFRAHTIDGVARSFFLASVAVLVAVYPLMFRRLFLARRAALASPLIVLISAGFLTVDGFYWVPAVVYMLALPLLLILVRRRTIPLKAAVALAALAAVTSLYRSQTGLGIVIALVAIAFCARGSRRRRVIAVLLVLVSYYTFSTGVLNLVYQARAHRMQGYSVNTGGEADVNTWADHSGHPFWHSAYIGLGIIHNPWGITWNDAVAAAYVKKVDPTAPYLSARYEADLRKRVLQIAVNHPGFMVHAYSKKLAVELRDGLQRFPALLLLLPVAVAAGILRRRRGAALAVVASLVALALAPSFIAIPSTDYEQPWFGLLAALAAICGGFLVLLATRPLVPAGTIVVDDLGRVLARAVAPVQAQVEAGWARVVRWGHRLLDASPEPSEVWPRAVVAWRSRSVQLRLMLTIAAVAIGIGARHVLIDHTSSALPAGPVTAAPGSAVAPYGERYSPLLATWTLRTLPSGWLIGDVGVGVQPTPSGLALRTSPGQVAYELVGPVIRLKPGSYFAVTRGRVETGGLSLGVLNVKKDTFINVLSFAPRKKVVSMPVAFTITHTMNVRVILTNNQPRRARSNWLLTSVLVAGPGVVTGNSPHPGPAGASSGSRSPGTAGRSGPRS